MLGTISKVRKFPGLSEIQDRYIILALKDKELSPTLLAKAINEISLGKCYPPVEKLHRILDKLEREGFISSREGSIKHRERGGRIRKYYQLTKKGVQQAQSVKV